MSAWSWGVYLVRGSAWSRGGRGLSGQGVCLVWGGLPGPGVGSAWSQRGVCLVWGGLPGLGGSAWSGGCLPNLGGSAWSQGEGGLPGLGGSGIPACTEADTLPPCGQTDTCKNITLATTSLRPVISLLPAVGLLHKVT